VLSFFGMVPAALMGIDVGRLLASARDMAAACRTEDPVANPGLALGAAMGAGALVGRNKLTLKMPERLWPLGLWIEQLVAESTGKHGKGVAPIAGEDPSVPPGDDRLVVSVTPDDDLLSLGGEFFRWEVATAAAGFLLDINPFDEPNVQQAKDATRVLLDAYTAQRRLPTPEPHASAGGVRLTLSDAAQAALGTASPLSFLQTLGRGDYFSLLAYLPSEHQDYAPVLRAACTAVGVKHGCASMLGYGPRYLHSTGQLHKGGPNTGVFVIVTAPAAEDLPIPDEPYSFGILELAQALGDFTSLDRLGRRALHVALPGRDPALLESLLAQLVS
jgi:hypothetical protein